MARFIPKNLADDVWKQISPQRPFALRANPDEHIFLRLGQGKSIYIELSPTQMGARVMNLLSYEAGEANLLHRVSNLAALKIGRSTECEIKIFNAVISRVHTEMMLDGNVLLVTDLGSSNGTFYHPDHFGFDVDSYLANRPLRLDVSVESTLDLIHETFGPALDDFLKRYSDKKDKNK